MTESLQFVPTSCTEKMKKYGNFFVFYMWQGRENNLKFHFD